MKFFIWYQTFSIASKCSGGIFSAAIRPISAPLFSCSQFGFLQIPSHDGHPCLWLTLPAAGWIRDFHLLECALTGAHKLCPGQVCPGHFIIGRAFTMLFGGELHLAAEDGEGGHLLGQREVELGLGVLGSVKGAPSESRIFPAVTGKGRRSGPTASRASPSANLFRREQRARPLSSQRSTMAQTCQSRMYREFSVYCPGSP